VLVNLLCNIESHISEVEQKPVLLTCATSKDLTNVNCLLSLDDYRIVKQAEIETTKNVEKENHKVIEEKLLYAKTFVAEETINQNSTFVDCSYNIENLDIDWETYRNIEAENVIPFSTEENNKMPINNFP